MLYKITSKVLGQLTLNCIGRTLTYGQSVLISDYQITKEVHILKSKNLISLVPVGG